MAKKVKNEGEAIQHPHHVLGLVILGLLLGLYSFRFFFPLGNETLIENFFSYVVEVEGDVIHPGLYFFSHQPTIKEVITKGNEGQEANLIIYPNPFSKLPFSSSLWVQRHQNGFKLSLFPLEGKKKILLGIPINLNTASVDDLSSLPGIGSVIARKIVFFRTTQRAFFKVEDLKIINGIGEKRFKRIEKYLTVTPEI